MSADVTLLSSIDTTETQDAGVRCVRFSPSGEPHRNGQVDAVVARYHAATGRAAPTPSEGLAETLAQAKTVHVLVGSTGAYGARSVRLHTGRVVPGVGGTPAFLPKGSRKNGFRLIGMLERAIDVETGPRGDQILRARLDQAVASVPTVDALTRGALTGLPANSDTCTVAVFGTYRFITGDIPGAIWLLNHCLPDPDDATADPIIEGVLIVPPGYEATSEHGSIMAADLLRMDMGLVRGFTPISYADAVALTDAPYEDALARVLETGAVAVTG